MKLLSIGYLLLATGCLGDENLFFTRHPVDLSVGEGSTGRLECGTSESLGVTVSWEREGETVHLDSRRHLSGQDLVIARTLHRLDHGAYACIATNATTGYSISSKTAILTIIWVGENVTVKPVDEIPRNSGENLELRCDAEGTEPLSIQWFRNGDGLKNSGKVQVESKTLRILGVNPLDNGVYRCIASNSAVSVSSINTVTLSVPGDQWAQIEVIPEDIVVNPGSNGKFDCVYHHADVTEWSFKQTGPLENSTHYMVFGNGTLVVLNVTPEDEGLYSCVGIRGESTEVPQVYSAYLHTAFLEDMTENSIEPAGGRLRVVGEGQDVELGCAPPKGRPKPVVAWHPKPPHAREGEDHILRIPAIRKKQAGNYTCTATNIARSTHVTVQLVVTTPPLITQNPISLVVDEGAEAKLRCEFTGSPKHSVVSWFRDGTPVRGGTRVAQRAGLLTLNSAAPSDSGEYHCRVTTPPFPPVMSQPATLIIKEKLKFSPRPVNKNLELGTVKKVHCKAQGSTPPLVKWFKDGQNIDDISDHISDINGTLHFNTVQIEDKGSYTCIATNTQGTINATIEIDVVVSPKFTILPRNPTDAYEGSPIVMDCVAEGDPKPAIHWDKNSVMDNFDKSRFQILENGSLLIGEVKATDEGKYGCTAGNSGGLKRYEVSLVVRGPDGYRGGDTGDGSMGGGSMLSRTVGITLGAAGAYMILVIGLMAYCRCRSRRNKLALQQSLQPDNLSQAEGGTALEGKTKCNGEAGHSDGDITAHSHNSATSKQSYGKLPVSRDDLSNMMVLGKGIFGEVSLAQVKGGDVVMVKSLQETRDEATLQEFKRELDLFGRLDHKNVSKLLGLCRSAEPNLMILQYTDWGDLKQMLIATKKERKDKPRPPEMTPSVVLNLIHQLSLGMEAVANHRLVHRDLAARNCLIASDLTLKISLSALCKDTYSKEYCLHRNKLMAVRWMPPEVISEDDYSSKSDAYSFGATCWEVVTGGELPFAELPDQEVVASAGSLAWGHPAPGLLPPALYALLDKCWSPNPSERPTFSQIALKVGDLVSELNKTA